MWVTYRLIKGSLAFHKGESLQAAAATAKKSTASGKNRTQTRVQCDCYLLLHNKPSHSLGWVSGVQPLSSRPAFDLGVEMRKGLVLSCGDRTTPRVLLLGSSLKRSKENNIVIHSAVHN